MFHTGGINLGGSNDPAGQQHAQSMGFLTRWVADAFLRNGHGPPWCCEARVAKLNDLGVLHPKDAPKVFVEFLGSLTLAAAGEEAFGSR